MSPDIQTHSQIVSNKYITLHVQNIVNIFWIYKIKRISKEKICTSPTHKIAAANPRYNEAGTIVYLWGRKMENDRIKIISQIDI